MPGTIARARGLYDLAWIFVLLSLTRCGDTGAVRPEVAAWIGATCRDLARAYAAVHCRRRQEFFAALALAWGADPFDDPGPLAAVSALAGPRPSSSLDAIGLVPARDRDSRIDMLARFTNGPGISVRRHRLDDGGALAAP